uniref:Uncharacterized protein n=1 Tax=Rhizophora mucronata TaxID=61149 RepID=A0A2P2IKX5_RHIMU
MKNIWASKFLILHTSSAKTHGFKCLLSSLLVSTLLVYWHILGQSWYMWAG